jgi:hypothetical protein
VVSCAVVNLPFQIVSDRAHEIIHLFILSIWLNCCRVWWVFERLMEL